MRKSKYQWQGEPVKVTFGNCMVKTNKDKPLWWYNFECEPDGFACIPAIQVTDKNGYSFLLANHFGIGVHKLLNGGWPNYQHFSLDGEFSTKPQLKYSKFDLDGFQLHEAARDKWQRKNFPQEWGWKQDLLEAWKRNVKTEETGQDRLKNFQDRDDRVMAKITPEQRREIRKEWSELKKAVQWEDFLEKRADELSKK